MSLNRFLFLLKSLGPRRAKTLVYRYWSDALALRELDLEQIYSQVSRTDIINFCISKRGARRYLEIGVRNPDDNFNRVDCELKSSVDPGVEFESNPVDFPMTSDDFFEHWQSKIGVPFDVIFIDGLHRADQVARDIEHGLAMTTDDGLLILHDCNPPHHEFARERFDGDGIAAQTWNGTTWKAVWAYFFRGEYELRVVDTDWGVGIIDKAKRKAPQPLENAYFEFDEFLRMKTEIGYVIDWEKVQAWLCRN